MIIDAHNHLQDHRLGDPEAIIGTMRKAGIARCVVNSTRESDWPAVENLAADHPDFILPAFGIHPWHAHTAEPGWQDRLTDLLEKHPTASIGECGVDGWIEAPSFEIQTPVFLDQLRLARELDRPVTIHCLKAWEPLFSAFEEQSPPSRFLMHSFGGSIEIARRLIPLGAYFSFSGYFLHPRKSKVIEVFRQLPADRILVETDAPDMLPPETFIAHPLPGNANHPANLPAIAETLAVTMNLTPGQLASLTGENFRRCFL
ncbi:MAG TPA: TatD family hydrolase [Luteolibacter sp.]|nr:TatD family hydrolase [Luteolibacter sp.]